MRALAALVALGAAAASAEPIWTSASREDAAVRAFAGVRSVGAAVELPAATFEAAWQHGDRTLELRAGRTWDLTRGKASFRAGASATGILVPQDQLDLGFGGHAFATLVLGGQAFSFQLGASSGVELFARGSSRFVERVHLGAEVRWRRLGAGVAARTGVDLAPGSNFVVRADAMVFLSWRPGW